MNIGNIINSIIENEEGVSISSFFNTHATGHTEICRAMNTAFIISLCGSDHKNYSEAVKYLNKLENNESYKKLAQFYLNGKNLIENEIKNRADNDTDFKQKLLNLNNFISKNNNFSSLDSIDALWSVFFPEAMSVFNNKKERSKELREKRTIQITEKNPEPINNPGRQIIFTSNILLTLPDSHTNMELLGYSEKLLEGIKNASLGKQTYYYDHPIQIGTPAESNEIIYGLNGLNKTAEWEKNHGNMDETQKITCILSASVTHTGLQQIAKQYIKEELEKYGNFEHLDVYIFTEDDTKKIIDEIFLPAAERLTLSSSNKDELLKTVFGVDGEYGRHYSFLKAIAAFWQILVDSDKTATFKIDLDQIFPEKELKEQSGKSAFEHFTTPLWGAHGIDSMGKSIELGMIAGALVNEKDIHKGLFTPDVIFDERQNLKLEERFFYSKLMMGLSTGSELATRYSQDGIDGDKRCIQRIHVTGGTNGILINALRKHRPFTPGFIGRAEDQAYLLSVLGNNSTGLAYLHEEGLIMRHDKEAFAEDAMKAASTGNMIGDFIRTLYFSRYTEILSDNITDIKKIIDPFTGCFVSKIPISSVLLRFCMKAEDLFKAENSEIAADFILQSFKRLEEAINFAYGKENLLQKAYINDRKGWNLFYDILDGIDNPELINPVKKVSIQINAARICAGCKV